MKPFTLWYLTENWEITGMAVAIKSQTKEEAIAQFIKNHPSDARYLRVRGGGRLGSEDTFDNPNSSQLTAIKEAEEIQRQAEEIQRQADIASLRNAIETLKIGSPDDLNYSQLEIVIGNHLLFPRIEKDDLEIYHLREDLYMRSLRLSNLQAIIQTRIVSDKLDALQMAITGKLDALQMTITGKLDALQTAITGVANTQVGIAKNQTKMNQTGLMTQAAMLTKLGNIEKDVDDVADGFFGED